MSKFKRVLFKLSGESLAPQENEKGIGWERTQKVAESILDIKKKTGTEIAIVIGGGNMVRGRDRGVEVDYTTADHIGMLGTIMNGLALEEAFNRLGGHETATLMTSIEVKPVAEPYFFKRARDHLEDGKIVVLGGGTGKSGCTTDYSAAIHAIETNCEVILKGSNVDGVYTSDPKKDPEAKRYMYLSYKTAIKENLEIMDGQAFALCLNRKIPILIFKAEDLFNVLKGEKIGTLVGDVEDEFYE
jgi:uridylate kinase